MKIKAHVKIHFVYSGLFGDATRMVCSNIYVELDRLQTGELIWLAKGISPWGEGDSHMMEGYGYCVTEFHANPGCDSIRSFFKSDFTHYLKYLSYEEYPLKRCW